MDMCKDCEYASVELCKNQCMEEIVNIDPVFERMILEYEAKKEIAENERDNNNWI